MLVVYKKTHISWSCPKRNWWKLRNTLTYHNFMLWYVRKQLLSCFLLLASYITNWQRLSPILKKKKNRETEWNLGDISRNPKQDFPFKELFWIILSSWKTILISTYYNKNKFVALYKLWSSSVPPLHSEHTSHYFLDC